MLLGIARVIPALVTTVLRVPTTAPPRNASPPAAPAHPAYLLVANQPTTEPLTARPPTVRPPSRLRRPLDHECVITTASSHPRHLDRITTTSSPCPRHHDSVTSTASPRPRNHRPRPHGRNIVDRCTIDGVTTVRVATDRDTTDRVVVVLVTYDHVTLDCATTTAGPGPHQHSSRHFDRVLSTE